jgi:hypothetical protein
MGDIGMGNIGTGAIRKGAMRRSAASLFQFTAPRTTLRTWPSAPTSTVDGNTRMPQARAKAPSGSRSVGSSKPVVAANWATAAGDSL